MKRLLIVILCVAALCTTAHAASVTVTSMKTDCTVSSGGECQVTQTFTLEITGIETELQFPVSEGAKNASVAGYSARRQSDGAYPVLVLQNPAGFSGTRTFTVLYSLRDLATEENRLQTLHLPLLCPKWSYAIASYQFTVTMPAPFEGRPRFSSGYYGDVIEDLMDVELTNGLIRGQISGGLRDHDSLDMTLEVGTGYFSRAYAAWSFSWFTAALIVALCLLALIYWAMKLKSPDGLRARARVLPPDTALPSDLPYLLACGTPQFNMLVLHWASLGYLTIRVGSNGRVTMRRRVVMGNERRSTERKLFDMLFSRGEAIEGASLLYKQTAQTAQRLIPRYWNRRIYEPASGNVRIMQALCCLASALAAAEAAGALMPANAVRIVLYVLVFAAGAALSAAVQYAARAWYLNRRALFAACCMAGLALLILGSAGGSSLLTFLAASMSVLTGCLTVHGGRRTPFGTQIVSQALGFRRFLMRVSENHLAGMQRRNGQYFYELLPYAESIGLGESVSKAFGDTELEPCGWYREEADPPRTAAEFHAHIRETLALLDLAIRR